MDEKDNTDDDSSHFCYIYNCRLIYVGVAILTAYLFLLFLPHTPAHIPRRVPFCGRLVHSAPIRPPCLRHDNSHSNSHILAGPADHDNRQSALIDNLMLTTLLFAAATLTLSSSLLSVCLSRVQFDQRLV